MTVNTQPLPIVVAVESKQRASIRYALEEAAKQHCGVRIVHAYAVPATAAGMFYGSELVQASEGDAHEVLESTRAYIESLGTDVAVEYSVRLGAPTRVLEEESRIARAVVLGPDDNSWYERVLVGEVGSWLVQHARCPVIVVPESWDHEEPRRGGVIVTIDGATDARGPLRFAFSAAADQELHVMHIVPSATSVQDEERERVDVAEVLAGWSTEFPDVKVFSSIVFGEVDEVTKNATKLANVVIVGMPHRKAMPFIHARPVAVSMIKAANCPVAVVPADFDLRTVRAEYT